MRSQTHMRKKLSGRYCGRGKQKGNGTDQPILPQTESSGKGHKAMERHTAELNQGKRVFTLPRHNSKPRIRLALRNTKSHSKPLLPAAKRTWAYSHPLKGEIEPDRRRLLLVVQEGQTSL